MGLEDDRQSGSGRGQRKGWGRGMPGRCLRASGGAHPGQAHIVPIAALVFSGKALLCTVVCVQIALPHAVRAHREMWINASILIAGEALWMRFVVHIIRFFDDHKGAPCARDGSMPAFCLH